MPSTWRLQGFDVSSLQYPVEECLPANLSLDVLDAFDEIPPNLIGAFDIVHIRAFAAVIKGGDADPLTRNVLKLLSTIVCFHISLDHQANSYPGIEPGGYLQWDEFDTTTFAAHEPPNKQVDKQSADAIIDVWHRFAKKLDIALQYDLLACLSLSLRVKLINRHRWMPSLPSTLSNNGLTILDHPRFGSTDLTRKAATDNWMMALEEVGFVIMGRAGEAGGEITPEDYSDLLSRVVDETRSGVAIWIDMQVVAGRKDS